MAGRHGAVATLTAAEIRAAGRDPSRLIGAGFTRPSRGVYVAAGVDTAAPDARIAVAAAAIRSAELALGGWAAARLHERTTRTDGLTVFDGRLMEMDPGARSDQPVLICAPRAARVRPRPGARLFRSELDAGDVVELEGLRVTSPLRTAFDLARLWPTTSAVAAVDRFRALGLVAGEDLAGLVHVRRGWRGVERARKVVALSADGVESPRETMMRLLWCGVIPARPLCNAVVTRPDGTFVARVDLLDDVAGLVGEYDGADHAGAARRHADAVRQQELEALGLLVLRANDPDISSAHGRRAFLERLRAARARAVTWPRPRGWLVAPAR